MAVPPTGKLVGFPARNFMTDTYRGGYKKAILDVLNLLDKYPDIIRTKRDYMMFLKNFLTFLLQKPQALDEFMDTNSIDVSVSKKPCVLG